MPKKNQPIPFILGGINVRQKESLYCLNDLHRASGNHDRHQPNRFLRIDRTQEYIAYLESKYPEMGIIVRTLKGKGGGTYACKKIVLTYAMWISNPFHDSVLDVYEEMVANEVERAKEAAARVILKDEYRPMTDSLVAHRKAQGKEATNHFHFSNEADLINKAITGYRLREFKKVFERDSIRDNLTHEGKKAMIALQRANTSLLDMDACRDDRKDKLQKILNSRFSGKVLIDRDILLPTSSSKHLPEAGGASA